MPDPNEGPQARYTEQLEGENLLLRTANEARREAVARWLERHDALRDEVHGDWRDWLKDADSLLAALPESPVALAERAVAEAAEKYRRDQLDLIAWISEHPMMPHASKQLRLDESRGALDAALSALRSAREAAR